MVGAAGIFVLPSLFLAEHCTILIRLHLVRELVIRGFLQISVTSQCSASVDRLAYLDYIFVTSDVTCINSNTDDDNDDDYDYDCPRLVEIG
jgi:hypothetical protein